MTVTTELPTPQSVSESMSKVSRERRGILQNYETYIDNEIKARHEYERSAAKAWALARLECSSNAEADRVIEADEDLRLLKLQMDLATGVLRAAEKKLNSLKSDMDAAIARAYMVRQEMKSLSWDGQP